MAGVSAIAAVNNTAKVKSVKVFIWISPLLWAFRGGNPRRFVIAGYSRYGYQSVGAVSNRAAGGCGQAGVPAHVFGCLKQDLQVLQDEEVSWPGRLLFLLKRFPNLDF